MEKKTMKTKSLKLKVGEGLNTHLLESEVEFDYSEIEGGHMFILENGQLVHEEHDPISLTGGTYVSSSQVEYDPFDKSIREVYD